MSLKARWSVTVGGVDCTDKMNPYVESIEATDNDGGTADTATIVFDDAGGQVATPKKGAEVILTIEDVPVFTGVVDDAESVGSRGGGMQLNVSCTSVDKRGKAKERLGLHKDNATLEEFLKEAGKAAGITTVKVDPEFKSDKRPYWSTEGRSFLQLGRELAAELGATFKIQGKKAVFAKRGKGTGPDGGSLPTVAVVYGGNLISWRIRPNESRPRFAKARVRYYDRKAGKWKQEDVEIGAAPGASEETLDVPGTAKPNKDDAGKHAKGRKTESEREGGSGDVTIALNVTAFAEGTAVVSGIKADVDGSYRIATRRHVLTRAGSQTHLTLKQPQGEGDKGGGGK